MQKRFKWAALLLALMMLAGCAQETETEAPELLEPAGVQSDMAVAYIGEIYDVTCYEASVKPYVEGLSFTVSGQVMSISAYPGMAVEEGEELISLEQTSLEERAEQLQQELSYMQQDSEYTDTIAELEIDILEVELQELEDKQSTLNEKVSALKEKESALQEQKSALKEKETMLQASDPASEASDPASETSEPVSEESESVPEESEPAPEESEPVSQENELALVQEELAAVEAELAAAAEELAAVEAELPSVEKEIALKENEIEQKQTLLRQDKEQRELELAGTRKELAEINESLDVAVLRAPFAGRIIYGDSIEQGSWVQADDPIVFLADDSKLSIKCEYIPESVIQNTDRVYARIGAKEYELEYVPISVEEYISLAAKGADITTEFKIIASEEEWTEIEAGQYAAVCLWSNYVSDALLVPSGAVERDAAGQYVYVDENGSTVKRTVKTGVTTDGLAQIVEGLEEGDVVYVQE